MGNRKRTDSGDREPESAVSAERVDIERMMDDISSQSFPASDPPAWGVVASRLEELRNGSWPSEDDHSSR